MASYPGLKQPWALRRNRFAVKKRFVRTEVSEVVNNMLSVSAEWIENATRNYIAEHQPTHPEIAKAIEVINALPLYADWAGGVAIRSDGELIGFLWDEPQSAKVEADLHFRFLALVTGAERYSELK